MKETLLAQVEESLRRGNPQHALETTRSYITATGDKREEALELARRAAAVYRDLIAPPVMVYAEEVGGIPSESGPLVQKALSRLIRLTEDWEKKLWEVHVERLARELRDWTREKHLEQSAANIARLMALAPDGQRLQRARYIGATLATLVNNQREAEQLLKAVARSPQKSFVIAEEVAAMEAARVQRHRTIAASDIENLEREYRSVLTQTSVEIQNLLPTRNRMDEPDAEVVRDVGDIFRSILRVPIVAEEPDLFLDATLILVDFVQKDTSRSSTANRVEERAYNQLGFTAKKAVLLAFQDIGRNPFLASLYQQWAGDYMATDYAKPIIEFMGVLRSDAFNDFLRRMRADRTVSQLATPMIDAAMGSIADQESIEDLMTQLRKILGKRRHSEEDFRHEERAISGLGLVIKSPRTEEKDRARIREFLRTHVPEDLSRIARHAALEVFNFKIPEETSPHRQWAVRVLARALWAPDETTAHHKGADDRAILGDRQQIVDALFKLGSHEMTALLHAIEPLSTRYGIGFIGAAEVLEKLGDPNALPTLDRMLTTTLLYDEQAANVYQAEFIWDPAAQQRVPLKRDMVIEPLVYAVGRIGGPKADEILARYHEQIQSGRVPPPSQNVARHLDNFLKGKKLDRQMEEAEAAAPGEALASLNDVEALIKQLKSSYFFAGKTKRRAHKVAALTHLARLTPPDALDVVFKQLSDKDPMVVSATITCISEFAGLKKPRALKEMTVDQVLECLESRDPAVRLNAVKVLKEIGPTRKDIKEKVIAFAKAATRREVKDALSRALQSATMAGLGAEDSREGEGASDDGEDKPEARRPMTSVDKLELKRQYMEQRRAWIAAGKKGDPPPKPPGVD